MVKTIGKAGGRPAGSYREKQGSPRPFSLPDPFSRPLADTIVLTDREPNTGFSFSEFKTEDIQR